MGELTAILKLLDIAQRCELVELNFLRWIVSEDASVETLHAAFSRLRSVDQDTNGLVFIAIAIQQVWRQNDHVRAVSLPTQVLKQFDEPDVLIIALLTAKGGGSVVLDLTGLYKTVFEGNLHVGDDEYGSPYSTEAFAVQLVKKLKNAKAVSEKAKSPIKVFESVENERAFLSARLNPVLYEN